MFGELVVREGEQSVESRLGQAISTLVAPEVLSALTRLSTLAPQLEPALRALPVQPGALHVLSSLNRAVEDASRSTRSVGMFGALRSLRDPDVRLALGFLLEVAGSLGRALAETPRSLPESV